MARSASRSLIMFPPSEIVVLSSGLQSVCVQAKKVLCQSNDKCSGCKWWRCGCEPDGNPRAFFAWSAHRRWEPNTLSRRNHRVRCAPRQLWLQCEEAARDGSVMPIREVGKRGLRQQGGIGRLRGAPGNSSSNGCACNRRRLLCPSSPYHFCGARFLHFVRRNSLVGACALFAVLSRFLLGLVPAGKELLCRLPVAPFHLPHARNVVGVLVPVFE